MLVLCAISNLQSFRNPQRPRLVSFYPCTILRARRFYRWKHVYLVNISAALILSTLEPASFFFVASRELMDIRPRLRRPPAGVVLPGGLYTVARAHGTRGRGDSGHLRAALACKRVELYDARKRVCVGCVPGREYEPPLLSGLRSRCERSRSVDLPRAARQKDRKKNCCSETMFGARRTLEGCSHPIPRQTIVGAELSFEFGSIELLRQCEPCLRRLYTFPRTTSTICTPDSLITVTDMFGYRGIFD